MTKEDMEGQNLRRLKQPTIGVFLKLFNLHVSVFTRFGRSFNFGANSYGHVHEHLSSGNLRTTSIII